MSDGVAMLEQGLMSAEPISNEIPIRRRADTMACELAPGISLPRRQILGITVADIGRATAIAALETALRNDSFVRLAFCNAHTANLAYEQPTFRHQLEPFLVLPDGIGIDLASNMLYGQPFAENLNGTDFVPDLLRALSGPLSVRLVGARPGVAQKAARALKMIAPQHEIMALADGYQIAEIEPVVLAGLEREPVDIILVAMGNPLQEEWIATRIDKRHARLAIGVGALFDFLAGEVVRAPVMWRKLRVEWVYRLLQEPSRLFARYVIGNPKFLWRVVRQWARAT
jgi:exopolysaccharide biosynthesis WecB/TagA/CpsF family protein